MLPEFQVNNGTKIELPSNVCSMESFDGGLTIGCSDGLLQSFTSSGDSKTHSKTHGSAVTAMSLTDSGCVGTSSVDGSVKVINSTFETENSFEGSTDETYSMDSSGSSLVMGGEDSKLRFYKLNSESDQPQHVGNVLWSALLDEC